MRYAATVNLTPWARDAISEADLQEVAIRAMGLACKVGVIKGSPGWIASASSRDRLRRTERVRGATVAGALHMALDAYEREYVWTSEELVQVAKQSGMGVR